MAESYPCGHESIGHNDGPCCAVCEMGERLDALRRAAVSAREALQEGQKWIFRGCDDPTCDDGGCIDARRVISALAALDSALGTEAKQ